MSSNFTPKHFIGYVIIRVITEYKITYWTNDKMHCKILSNSEVQWQLMSYYSSIIDQKLPNHCTLSSGLKSGRTIGGRLLFWTLHYIKGCNDTSTLISSHLTVAIYNKYSHVFHSHQKVHQTTDPSSHPPPCYLGERGGITLAESVNLILCQSLTM